MNYLINRQGRYYFNRRVPQRLKEYDPRPFVRVALNTDSKQIAIKLAIAQNDQLESYWNSLIKGCSKHSDAYYKSLVERARFIGFPYQSSQFLADLPLNQLIERLNHAEKFKLNEKHVEAVLGGMSQPVIKIDDALARFWDYSKPKILNKSPNQIRKWKNPRIKAINNLIKCIGNKNVNEITRDDMLRFRDWWIERMESENMISGSANKDIIYCKTIIESAADNLKINIDVAHIFKKLIIIKDDSQKRLSFETSYINSILLNPNNLKGLNEQAKWVLHAIAETGAGIGEQVGLLPEDIILDADIPHISIMPRNKKALKTKYRKRIIPLVGYALDAFKACPKGFFEYHDRPDALSALLSKVLSERNLFPTEHHTVYSLRHSFQDRLLAVNAPDRIQAELMGHKFHRPAYGEGGTLAQKFEVMKKIVLKHMS